MILTVIAFTGVIIETRPSVVWIKRDRVGDYVAIARTPDMPADPLRMRVSCTGTDKALRCTLTRKAP